MTNGNDAVIPTFEKGSVSGDLRPVGGLTKREYFAAMAMQGLLAFPNGEFTGAYDLVTEAIEHANALIAVLNDESTSGEPTTEKTAATNEKVTQDKRIFY